MRIRDLKRNWSKNPKEHRVATSVNVVSVRYPVGKRHRDLRSTSVFSLGTILLQGFIDRVAVLFLGYLLMKGFEGLARKTGRLEEYKPSH
jgi:hypothetical protein